LFFLSGFFKTVDFFVGSNYINTEDNCERLIDFLGQISKLSSFNVLDLADFMMHHWSPVSFFVLLYSTGATPSDFSLDLVIFRFI